MLVFIFGIGSSYVTWIEMSAFMIGNSDETVEILRIALIFNFVLRNTFYNAALEHQFTWLCNIYKPLTQIIFIYDDEHLDIFNVVKIVQQTTIEFEFGINLVSVLFTLMSIAMEQNSSLKPIYTVGILWKYLPFSKINCLINMIRFALNAKFCWNGYKYRDLCLLHFEQTQSDISCNIFFHSLHEIKWVSKMILSLRFRIQNWNKRIKMMCVDVGFLDQSTWNPVLLVHQLQFIHIKCFTSLRFNVCAIILFMHSLCPR